MPTVAEALRQGAARLREAGIPGAARDARLLMARALGVPAGRLGLAEGPLSRDAGTAFAAMIEARLRRQPVSQILGRRAFWGRDFEVTPDVLDPRPETETLVALALGGPPAAALLDLGTGSGALLVTLLAEWPRAQGTGTDTSAAALAVARRNAGRHGVAGRATLLRSDWADGISGRFDLVVCNPPYLSAGEVDALEPDVRDWEPRHALVAGPTGLEAYRAIAPDLARLLSPGGAALFEAGAGQGAAVAGIFREAGFGDVALHPDLDGRDRVVEIRVPG